MPGEINSILQADLEKFSKSFPFFKEIAGKRFLITGATGLIGSMMVRVLLYLREQEGQDIYITALARNPRKAEEMFAGKDIDWVFCDISDPVSEKVSAPDYIIHCAANTSSKMMAEQPVETFLGLIDGTRELLKFAAASACKSMVYLSSIESYGTFSEERELEESDLGAIDPLNNRSCYPLGKKGAEFLCHSYHSEYKVPVKIARLTQTFGAGVSPDDNRVFAQFARSLVNGEDIVLHTTGESSKPYCYITDAISAIFYILLKGKNGEAYNVANADTYISVRNMAEMLEARFGKGGEVKLKLREDMGYAAPTKNKLKVDKLMELGWKPEYRLEEMFSRLIEYLKEVNERTDS